MKILVSAYACEPGRGSEPGVGWNWAQALCSSGHEVWVLTRSNNRRRIEDMLGASPGAGRLKFIYYDLPWCLRAMKRMPFGIYLYYFLWQIFCLPVAAEAHRVVCFDYVHHLTFGSWRQPSHLYRLGAPFIFGPVGGGEMAPYRLVRSLPFSGKLAELARLVSNWLALANPFLRRCIRSATIVAARTPETAEWLRRLGCNPILGSDVGASLSSRAWEGKKGGTETLSCIFVGRLLGWKGAHLAIDAVALARAAGHDITLTMIGEGRHRGWLERRALKKGLGSAVAFRGQLGQDGVFEHLGSHDLFLFPSLHDSGGTVVLEALAHGLPVVCLDLGGPRQFLDADCGEVVATGGRTERAVAESIAAALIRAHSDPLRLQAMSRAARKKAEQQTWRAAAMSVYQDLSIDR